MKRRQWVCTTIAEPFPVLGNLPNEAVYAGPFYAAGSQWFDFPDQLDYRQQCANALRAKGFTVSVELVAR